MKPDKQIDVILTADRTLLNSFHLIKNFAPIFYGTADVFPDWLYKFTARKPRKDKNNEVIFAPYPLRKIEAKMIDDGLNVIVLDPSDVPKYINRTKVLAVHTVNPLGLATFPPSHLLSTGNVVYSVDGFQNLLKSAFIKTAKKNGLKILVGGAGAWQLQRNRGIQEELGIDCTVVGEAENIISPLLQKCLNGEELPASVECTEENVPDVKDIVHIKKGANSGCVEIGRGCVRGCKFCDVTRNKTRWIPCSMIEKELEVNSRYGLTHGLIHAEDFLLYGQKGVIPDVDKVLRLIRLIKKYYKKFHITHFSLAAVSAEPRLIPQCMKEILEQQNCIIGETGIETGSVRLMAQTMSGKIKPFEQKRWIEVIHNSLRILHENSFIPYCSFILGLPGETEEDKIKTLELIINMRQYRCLMLPGNFTSLGRLERYNGLSANLTDLDDVNREIVKRCIEHNLHWISDICQMFFKSSNYESLLNLIKLIWIRQYKKRAKKAGLF